MENFPSELDLKNLVKELSQGRELTKQLQIHLHAQSSSSSSSSNENLEFLLHRILYSYDQALSILRHTHPAAELVPPPAAAAAMLDSPGLLAGSPHSEDSDQDLKDQASRKRNKGVVRWSEKIKVCAEAGIEGQLDDGYGWRKYGQKDILGAKYPRGYYRCTYRHPQGCLATKQVQRSDHDPTTFEITYRRNHTCNPRANMTSHGNSPPAPMPVDAQHEDPNPSTQYPQNEPLLFNIQTRLTVKTQDLGTNENPSFHPFNFSSSSSIHPENNPTFSYGINSTLGNYNLISTNDEYGGLIPNLKNSDDSELSPIVAAMTSITNSPTLGTNFPFDSSFGNPGFYP